MDPCHHCSCLEASIVHSFHVSHHLIAEANKGETMLVVLCGNWPIGKVVGLSYN